MTFTELHRLAVAANLAYVPWNAVNASTPRALATQASGFEQLSPRWTEEFFTDAPRMAWTIPVAGIQPNDASGFAAQLIDTAEGRILSLRGTEFRADHWQAFAALLPGFAVDEQTWLDAFGADLDILVPGLAVQQAVSLANYLQRLKAPAGSEVVQVSLQLPTAADLLSLTTSGLARFLADLWQQPVTTFTATGLGLLSAHESLRVVGHSLGGHLAALALRLFPDLISDATVFNAPGFDTLRFTGFTDEVVGAVSSVLGLQPAPDFASLGDRLLNVVVESAANDFDLSLVPSTLTGADALTPGFLLRTEVNSHSMDQIADNLAALSLLEQLTPGATQASRYALFDASSGLAARSVEDLLGSLSRLLLGPHDYATVVAGGAAYPEGTFNLRVDQLDALWQLQKLVSTQATLRLDSLLDYSAPALAALALDDPGTRYALRAFDPYRVIGEGPTRAALEDPLAFDNTLVSAHELADRTLMYQWEMERRRRDDIGAITAGSEGLQFEDRRQGLHFAVLRLDGDSPPLLDFLPQLVFGDDASIGERMRGARGDDRLYAGGGPDELDGGPGDDRLEGGADDDVLLGGDGADQLLGGPGNDVLYGADGTGTDDGAVDWLEGGPGMDELWAGPGDELRDRDGRLHVLLGAQWVTVSGRNLRALPGDGVVSLYETADDTSLLLAFHHDSRTLRVGTVTIHDFTSGDLDLLLPAPAPQVELPLRSGTAGPDRLQGSAAAEALLALAGDDTVMAGSGDDRVLGGDGNDVLQGDAGGDQLLGEAGRDVLLGEDGDDRLDGGDGADALSGDAGRDVLMGGNDADLLAGGAGQDLLLGGPGDDVLLAGVAFLAPTAAWRVTRGPLPLGHVQRDPRNAEILGLPGLDQDSLNRPADPDGDLLYGEAGDDFLIGSAGPDFIDGGPDDDTALGGDGDDVLHGGTGDDHLRGSGGADRLDGGEGNDFLVGHGRGDDGEQPDAGDVLAGGAGDDELQGGPGEDQLRGDDGNDRLYGGDDDDRLDGGAGNDELLGDAGDDILEGGTGDDRLTGGAGADELDGGEGADVLSGESGADHLEGGEGDDRLAGGAGADVLEGDAGNDRLSGGSGADWLDGGTGDDTLNGGSGNDLYLIHAAAGRDVLIDPGGDDGLWLRDLRSPESLSIEVQGTALIIRPDTESEIRIEAFREGTIDWLRLGEELVLDGAHLLDLSQLGLVREVGNTGFTGSPGDDELRIRLEAGTVSGGAGNDRYLLPARGVLGIEDPDTHNTLVFAAGARPDQLQVGGTPARWQLSLGELELSVAPDRFARYVFDSGFTLSAADLRARFLRELPTAPVPVERIGNHGVIGGSAFEFALPTGAFVDPNPGDTLALRATLADGSALPRWLSFDAARGRFSGVAPDATRQSLTLEVTATDGDGLHASQRFGLDVQPPFAPGAAAVFATSSLDGGNGAWITPPAPPFAARTLPAVAALGDLNGDGFDDLLLGNRLVFGQRTRVGNTLDPATARGLDLDHAPEWLSGTTAFTAVPPLRIDVNGDGREDVLLDPDASAEDPTSRVLLARAGYWPSSVDFNTLPLASEFTWPGSSPYSGLPVLANGTAPLALTALNPLGDFNGDGLGDFAVSALLGTEQRAWHGVVFGVQDELVTVDLAGALEGRALALLCPPYGSYPHFNPGGAEAASGWGELSAVGDVNGDGLADLGLGSAPYLYADGNAYGAVVFGRRQPTASLDLNVLDGVNGFLVAFPEPGTGHALAHRLRAAGDVNGDGNDDLLGLDEASGASFLVYGRAAFASALTVGSVEDDLIVTNGEDVFAGAGDDEVTVRGIGVMSIDPGAGRNTVLIEASTGAELQLRGGAGQTDYRLASIAAVDIHLRGTASDRLILPPGLGVIGISLERGMVRMDTGAQGPRLYLDDLDPARLLDGPTAIGAITLAEGTPIDLPTLLAGGFALEGTDETDHLHGSSAGDRLHAGAGDDWLEGGAGNDFLDGGQGNDHYLLPHGSGLDRITDLHGEDVLVFPDLTQFSALDVRHEGMDLVLVQDGATQVRLTDWHRTLDARIEWLQLGDAPPLALGALVNRAPHALGFLPVYRAYLDHAMAMTVPTASIVDPDPLDTLTWQLSVAEGDWPAGLEWNNNAHQLAGHPTTPGRFTLSLTVIDPFGAGSSQHLTLLVEDDAKGLAGTSADDLLEATPLRDHVLGRAGNDTLFGLAGSDVLSGGPGADVLWGGEGDDSLRGGPGDDVLDGGPGDDTYVFEPGAGFDEIRDTDGVGHDTLLVRGVKPRDLALWRDDSALAIGLRGTGDVLRVAHWFDDPAARVEAIRISEGPQLLAAEVDVLLEAMARFDPGHGLDRPLPVSSLLVMEPVLAAVWH